MLQRTTRGGGRKGGEERGIQVARPWKSTRSRHTLTHTNTPAHHATCGPDDDSKWTASSTRPPHRSQKHHRISLAARRSSRQRGLQRVSTGLVRGQLHGPITSSLRQLGRMSRAQSANAASTQHGPRPDQATRTAAPRHRSLAAALAAVGRVGGSAGQLARLALRLSLDRLIIDLDSKS